VRTSARLGEENLVKALLRIDTDESGGRQTRVRQEDAGERVGACYSAGPD
jgi:hypothetical protein